ncbi:MAG: DEAD/DEAH box helicase [Armatimonadota bacterium]
MPDPIIEYDELASLNLLKALSDGAADSPDWFRLRMMAEIVSLSPGFDKLLSLDSNNINEYPHQVDAVLTALRKMRGRALLADEVGLGKTIEAGIILKELILRGLAKKILILVPASLTGQWQEEMFTKFNLDFVVNTTSDGWTESDKIIASLDLAKRPEHAAKIVAGNYDLLIIDEAHRLRNRTSQAWTFVNSINRKYMLLLTATPVHNDMSELYSLITLLKPGLLKTYRSFRQRYVNPNNPLRPVNGAELKALLSEVMIRNRRSSVSVKFPPRTAYTYNMKLSGAEWELYSAVTGFIRASRPTATDLLSLSLLQREVCSSASSAKSTLDKLASAPGIAPGKAEHLRQIADMAGKVTECSKVEGVCKIVEKAQDKVIVFTEFIESQKLIMEALKGRGISAVEFNGSLTVCEKNAAITAFKGDTQVLVSTESGGEGRNLQFCNVMINYDLPWNPMLIEQRIGRIHRLGQTREVFIFNLASHNTIESYILDLLANKIKMFELVVGELDLILGNMETKDTFESALRKIWIQSTSDNEIKSKLDDFGKKLSSARARFAEIKEAETIVSKLFT